MVSVMETLTRCSASATALSRASLSTSNASLYLLEISGSSPGVRPISASVGHVGHVRVNVWAVSSVVAAGIVSVTVSGDLAVLSVAPFSAALRPNTVIIAAGVSALGWVGSSGASGALVSGSVVAVAISGLIAVEAGGTSL